MISPEEAQTIGAMVTLLTLMQSVVKYHKGEMIKAVYFVLIAIVFAIP